VRTRYPKDGDPTKGPVKLLSIDPASGWVADNTTWKSGLTKIFPARQFKGDLGHSSWLQNEDIAFIYRAYVTHNNPLTIASPGPCGPGTPAMDPGSNVPITVDAGKFPNWKTMAFYDGAQKLGTVTTAPTQFTATNLTPGYHVFSVLGTDAQGTVRTSDPVMVVVRAAVMHCMPPNILIPLLRPSRRTVVAGKAGRARLLPRKRACPPFLSEARPSPFLPSRKRTDWTSNL
jgi:hypothetical protein